LPPSESPLRLSPRPPRRPPPSATATGPPCPARARAASPNFHFLDNPNICLPEVHHVQVGLIPVQADLPIADQQSHQTCNVGQATQGAGDAPLSHLIG
jgi:hypothetical protein